LESGHDGVGDYTRRLAGRVKKTGHKVYLVAINDQYIDSDFEGYQSTEEQQIPVLRISSILNENERIKRLTLLINDFHPDWISLQFVPFAFHRKGLAFNLASQLRKIGKESRWHIMFHELWLGMQVGASKKEMLWGFFQRKLILSLVKSLNPSVIHTQSRLYKNQLAEEKIEANLLPLFSNIPVCEDLKVTAADNFLFNGDLTLVMFGSVHNTGGPVIEFAEEVKSFSDKTGKSVKLILLGRGGHEQEVWGNVWKNLGMEVTTLGEQSSAVISGTLRNATFGLTTTVLEKVEKSGSVAAMLEHELSVICVAGEWKPRYTKQIKSVTGITEYQKGNLESVFLEKKKPVVSVSLNSVSLSFLASLESIT
jgi:hypothetical protein